MMNNTKQYNQEANNDLQENLTTLEKINKKYNLAIDEVLEVSREELGTFDARKDAFSRIRTEVVNEYNKHRGYKDVLKADYFKYVKAKDAIYAAFEAVL